MKNSFVSAKKIQRDMIIEKYFDKKSKLDLNTGDVVKLGIKIDEGKNKRIQYYEGLIIKEKNSGISKTITVRKIVQGIGTERVFPIHSPKIFSIERKRSSIVRRAKLYYLRKLSGKATRLKQRFNSRGWHWFDKSSFLGLNFKYERKTLININHQTNIFSLNEKFLNADIIFLKSKKIDYLDSLITKY